MKTYTSSLNEFMTAWFLVFLQHLLCCIDLNK